MQLLRWVPAILWLGIISYLSFSSLQKMPIPNFFSADKIGHIGMYLILELLLFIPLSNKPKQLWIFTILALLYSVFTELVQHFFINNRYGELGDLLANGIGLFLGYLILRKKIKT